MRRLVLFALAAPVLGFAAWVNARLGCAEPVLRSDSPDGAYSLTVCRGLPQPFAMPGQGSDGPGWVVLRDARGWIAGVVALGSLLEVGHAPRWEPGRAELPLAAGFDLPPAGPAWLHDALWRLRAAVWLVPSGTAFR